ncbi:MAG: substrate-binding domain-containing protein [Verrucomicrobia bacterium]|nr:substrate-binding domain-containing protein [Verrucomicrobiota bacterium]MCH8513318.1 substrate-binding domain-containing protein [Kiritimatiellia bacterium]
MNIPPRPKNIAMIGMAMYGQDAGIVRGAAHYAQHRNWRLHLCGSQPREIDELHQNINIDGIIAHVTSEDLAEQLRKLDMPVVNVSGKCPMQMGFPFVAHEVGLAGVMAAEYFLQRGYRTFACEPAPGRFQEIFVSLGGLAFANRIKEEGLVCHELTQSLTFTREGVDTREQKDFPLVSVTDLPRPAAVFVMGDRLGARLCALSQNAGLAIPDDLAILGFGNFELVCETCYPPLSSIQTDDERQGRIAAELLYDLIRGCPPESLEHVISPLGVVTRRSTDALALEDPQVSKAVQFIRGADLREITCDQVASASGVNRRTLERKFREILGRTLYTEIQRWRSDLARHLLQTSSLPLKSIALEAGFRNSDHMGKVLRKHLGKTPREIRNTP